MNFLFNFYWNYYLTKSPQRTLQCHTKIITWLSLTTNPKRNNWKAEMTLLQSMQEKYLTGENGNEPKKPYVPVLDITWHSARQWSSTQICTPTRTVSPLVVSVTKLLCWVVSCMFVGFFLRRCILMTVRSKLSAMTTLLNLS